MLSSYLDKSNCLQTKREQAAILTKSESERQREKESEKKKKLNTYIYIKINKWKKSFSIYRYVIRCVLCVLNIISLYVHVLMCIYIYMCRKCALVLNNKSKCQVGFFCFVIKNSNQNHITDCSLVLVPKITNFSAFIWKHPTNTSTNTIRTTVTTTTVTTTLHDSLCFDGIRSISSVTVISVSDLPTIMFYSPLISICIHLQLNAHIPVGQQLLSTYLIDNRIIFRWNVS